ncbi:protein kinase [Pseudomonas chlororaphis]|uniref:Protein kinase n=1 Tax=Pseudomonas chlororaphis TaxID=587753 RepID=A0AB34C688_9PSED|nr:protein kinase [Pseudomonas chlororaphis]KAA5842659.1 protein kinase [Pseudomonas chlororaphis]
MANVENLTGTKFQEWTLTEIIGRGADGIVYAAENNAISVAIKLFFPECLESNGIANARERLELQLSLIGQKHHPNLVEIYGGGEDSSLGTIFLIMELVPGKSLDKIIGNIPPPLIKRLAHQLSSAARFLETLELVHRDIKPANIIISDDHQTLTLLDLGIIYQLPDEDDQGRLSGAEFVATLRYSPPEFVWRTEEGNFDDAWRAVTFYQIGATLHDMIMGVPIFSGHDRPRACLYDSVRDRTPIVESKEVDGWLIQTIQACLLKDWRQRLQLISWDSFTEPASATETQQQESRIRLRQLRNEEIRNATEKQGPKVPELTREQRLWHLNNTLILEIRTYLIETPIFPKCRVLEESISQKEYITNLHFECDASKDFHEEVVFSITLSVDSIMEEATKLSFKTILKGQTIASLWTEMFTVESAFLACQRSFLNAVESMVVS